MIRIFSLRLILRGTKGLDKVSIYKVIRKLHMLFYSEVLQSDCFNRLNRYFERSFNFISQKDANGFHDARVESSLHAQTAKGRLK